MVLFVVGSTDYTNHILVPTYNINAEEVGTSWVDGNHITHKDVYRTKIKGEFDMYFFSNTEFETFKTALDTRRYDNYTPVSLYVANEMEFRQANVYITIAPKMTRYAHGAVKYDVFTVQIEER